jgi:hypothetical protein
VGLIWWTLARKSPVRSVGIDIVAHRITVQLATYRRQEPLSIRSTKRQHSRPYVTWSSKACSLCPFGSLSCDRTVGGTQRGTSLRIPHQIANDRIRQTPIPNIPVQSRKLQRCARGSTHLGTLCLRTPGVVQGCWRYRGSRHIQGVPCRWREDLYSGLSVAMSYLRHEISFYNDIMILFFRCWSSLR